MTPYEADLFRRCTGRRSLPDRPFREAWVAVGRKGRKSATAGQIAVYAAVYGQWKRAPGETLRVVVIALSKDQARITLDYSSAILASRPGLARLVVSRDSETIRLSTGVEIACFPNSYRLVRGPTICCAILDEVAVWWNNELAANPDREVLRALKPAMITQPDSLLVGLSSPYAKKGLLYEKYRDHYGRDDSNVLIWQASTSTMNPQVDTREIEQAYRDDPVSAAAEFGAEFRSDLQSFVDRETLEACVAPGCRERAPVQGTHYYAFLDCAGGSGTDSMALCVGHRRDDTVVVDCLREINPPFSPSSAVAEFAETLKAYSVYKIISDKWGGDWPIESFRAHSISCEADAAAKSDLYRELLPIINSGKIDLLDHPRAISQLCALERRVARGGKDSIDHPPNGHDDLGNCIAGMAVLAKRPAYDENLDFVNGPGHVDAEAAAAQEFLEARFEHHLRTHSGYYRTHPLGRGW
jgi:hypothetical protein